MNKYTIFRMPSETDDNYDQHEVVGVEYGKDIYDATNKLIQAVCEDLSENPEYAKCEVFAEPPEEVDGDTPYQYQMSGIVSPVYAEINTVIYYGITEAEDG